VLDAFGEVIAAGGSGVFIASMAAHLTSLPAEVERRWCCRRLPERGASRPASAERVRAVRISKGSFIPNEAGEG
jgi:hypothetical protein